MGGEEEAIDQASAARRERLRALRAAKELLSTPDSDQPSDASKQDRKYLVQTIFFAMNVFQLKLFLTRLE